MMCKWEDVCVCTSISHYALTFEYCPVAHLSKWKDALHTLNKRAHKYFGI